MAARNDLQFINSFVVLGKDSQLVAEASGLASSLNFNLSRKCLELVNVPWPSFLLNRQQLQVELLLVRLLQEGHKEARGFKNLGAQDRIQEPLIV